MFRFITKQPFWVNLVLAILFSLVIIFVLLQSLSWFTNHGAYLKVPSVTGKNSSEAIRLLEQKGFDVVIQDSVFEEDQPRSIVLRQMPDPEATVKVNRTVFLTINRATPPLVEMPKLEGLTLRFALDLINRNHLKLGDTVYKPDFMKGSILEQQHNGVRIAPGTLLQWGSKVSLVIGAGLVELRILVPDLIGLTLAEAKAILDVKGITLAGIAPIGKVSDSLGAYIHRQNPDTRDYDGNPLFIQPGQTMDVWIAPNIPSVDSIRKAKFKEQNPQNF